jgi:hypothetical protein
VPRATPTERNGSFGNLVSVLLGLRSHTIEQIVQSNEVRSLDVPVRLLCLQMQIDRIGEMLVEQLDHRSARCRR